MDTNRLKIEAEKAHIMTIEEFEAKYKDVELKFSSYYKYVFTFFGVAPDGAKISADFGGSSDDIYRHSVTANEARKVGNLRADWMAVSATMNGEEFFEFYDY